MKPERFLLFASATLFLALAAHPRTGLLAMRRRDADDGGRGGSSGGSGSGSSGGFDVAERRSGTGTPGPLADPADNMVYGAILGGIIGGFLGGPPGVVAGAYLGIAGAAAAELIFPDPRSPPGGDSPPPGGDSPPPGPDNCFVSGTPIVTESGLLPIEQITAGLRVKTFDTETKRPVLNKVLEVFQSQQQEIVLLDVGGERISCTPRHRFRRNNEWVAAGRLRGGDRLLTVDGSHIPIDHIETRSQPQKVFNLSVDQMHNYFVGASGLLVHNVKRTDAGDAGPDC